MTTIQVYSKDQVDSMIPSAQVNSDWNASSGVAQILNKPTIPSGDQLVPSTSGVSVGNALTVTNSGTGWAEIIPTKVNIGGTTYTLRVSSTDEGLAGYITFVVE